MQNWFRAIWKGAVSERMYVNSAWEKSVQLVSQSSVLPLYEKSINIADTYMRQ